MKKALKIAGITAAVCTGAAIVAIVAKSLVEYKYELDNEDFEEEDDDYFEEDDDDYFD